MFLARSTHPITCLDLDPDLELAELSKQFESSVSHQQRELDRDTHHVFSVESVPMGLVGKPRTLGGSVTGYPGTKSNLVSLIIPYPYLRSSRGIWSQLCDGNNNNVRLL